MFKPEKIEKATIILPTKQRTVAMIALQDKAILQIKDTEVGLDKLTTEEDEHKILNLHSRLLFVKDNLDLYSNKSPQKILAQFFSGDKKDDSKKRIMRRSELYKRTEDCLEIVEENVRQNIKNIERLKEKRAKNDYYIETLFHFPNVPLDALEKTENLCKIVGIISSKSVEKISSFKSGLFIEYALDKRSAYLVAMCSLKDAASMEEFLHGIGFVEIELPSMSSRPSELIRHFRSANQALARKEREIKKELRKLYLSYYGMLDYFYGQVQILKERMDGLSMMRATDSFTVCEAWVPKSNKEHVKNVFINIAPGCMIFYEDADDSAPTRLNNPKLIRPFEKILALHSLPKYKDLDPTPILAISFTLFFGFIVADVIYGFFILLFGMLILGGRGRYSQKSKEMGMIVSLLGISTVVFGAVFGSYFGDFFTKMNLKIPGLLEPLSQAMIILVIALIIGGIHISSGLIFGLVQNLRKKLTEEAFSSQGVLLAFMISLVLFVFGLNTAGLVFLFSAIIGQLVFNIRKSGFIPAMLSVFGFAGFVGDLFSYGRLMALMVSSSGISLAFNFMAILAFGIPVVGPVVAVIVFILGHIFNLLMSCLGGFVHTTRLHFLEFFSKFYDGSGKKYVPFGYKEE